jgi:ribosome-associated protein
MRATLGEVSDALQVTADCEIPLDELEWRFTPSGGPGGQHANRAATRAEVSFDVARSPSLTEGQRARLLRRVGEVVTVAADDERSQLRNRALALDRLRRRLADALYVAPPRRPTRPTRGSVERRLQAKRRRSQVKRSRRAAGED